MKLIKQTYRAFIVSFSLLAIPSLFAQTTTWTDFSDINLGTIGTTRTYSLGGGSTVDILFQSNPILTGQEPAVTHAPRNFGNLGVAETGLNYTDLTTAITLGGGGGPQNSISYTVTFSNFSISDNHSNGYLFFGDVANTPQNPSDGLITFTETGSADILNWTQEGSQFALVNPNAVSYNWSPISGQLTSPSSAPDAGGIILNVGSLADYTQIQFVYSASRDDAFSYSIGETVVPEPSIYAAILGGLGLLMVALRKTPK